MASREKGTVFGGRYIVQSQVGTGGMVTKLHAVEIAFEKQIPVALCNGADPAILYDVLSGDFTGTLFVPAEKEAE